MLRSIFRGRLTAVFLAAAIAGGTAYTPANAQQAVAQAPLSAYGALPSLEMLELSPSGDRMAFITVNGEERTLVLLDLTTRQQVGGAAVGQAKVRGLDWIGEDRVLVTTSSSQSLPEIGLIDTEWYAGQIYDPVRNTISQVFEGTRGVLPYLFENVRVMNGDGESLVFARGYARANPERLDLFRIEPETGRGRAHEIMGQRVDSYVLDPSGQSVAQGEYERMTGIWKLLLRQNGAFREVWSTTAPLDAPRLMGLGIRGDSVIVAAERPDMSQPGRPDAEFFDVNLETGVWRAVRFEFIPDRLLFHPVTGRLMGASKATDQGRVFAMADPAAGALWARVQQTFAGRSPDMMTWSNDLQTALVYTASDNDPGTYYALDFAAGSAIKVGSSYDGIRPEQVAPVRPVEYTAADGLVIHGILTTPPGVEDPRGLPLVVLPHGGPASHDTLSFDYWAQAIASRGYVVLQPNFRGSTGQGDAFREAGYGEWGRKMQTDLSDGVRWLAEQGMIDPQRVCIVGASYGGYAALAGVTVDHGVYRCAVSYSGVSDLRRMLRDEARDSGHNDNPTVRYWNRFMGANGFDDRSLDERSPAFLAARAEAPILLMHGREDHVVPIIQSRVMADALRDAGKPYEFIELDGEDHWLSRGETRTRMLTETIRFLQAHNPTD